MVTSKSPRRQAWGRTLTLTRSGDTRTTRPPTCRSTMRTGTFGPAGNRAVCSTTGQMRSLPVDNRYSIEVTVALFLGGPPDNFVGVYGWIRGDALAHRDSDEVSRGELQRTSELEPCLRHVLRHRGLGRSLGALHTQRYLQSQSAGLAPLDARLFLSRLCGLLAYRAGLSGGR